MTDTKLLQQERTQLFKDVYDGKIPKRVPIEIWINWEAGIRYAGMDLKESQWNEEKYVEFYDKCCADFQTDKAPISRTLRPPQFYQILESKSFVMSKEGNMQHPEISCLEVEEYDEFIADPYECMVTKLLPRLYPALDTQPMKAAMVLGKAFKAYHDVNGKMAAVGAHMTEKYGFAQIAPGAGCEAPMDFLADLIRSFTNIVKDIRRVPDKVEAACEAVLPICEKTALSPISSNYARTFIPLHMAPFMNQAHFERFWWPTFMKLMKYIDDGGSKGFLFCEQDWMPKIDFLNELPIRQQLWFEYGDPALAKEKVGKNHIITGFYPATLLQTGTKQQCTDEAKRQIDILAPGGGYIFNLDKIIFSFTEQSAENLKAVIETVREYGKY
ncbi:MAG: uroporphyrinogen decarboxylase family protein [Anaerofustis sp.]